MSEIRSFAVGNGDMYYIKHNSDNFTIIDSCMSPTTKDSIIHEIKIAQRNKSITRFISTHPDQDHLAGLDYLDDEMPIVNFYCIKNKVTKSTETTAFKRYCELRDSSKAFYISKGCVRKWMNKESDERGSAGISILWPDTSNLEFQKALRLAELGGSPNNISAIIKYAMASNIFLWFGDLDGDFLDKVIDGISLPKASVIFAPHHGRGSGKIPRRILEMMNPKLIVIGEAPSEHLDYYAGYNTITQNRCWGILFEVESDGVHIYSENPSYSLSCLTNKRRSKAGWNYVGSINPLD